MLKLVFYPFFAGCGEMQFFTTTIAKLNEIIENGSFSDFKQILCDVRGFPQQLHAWVEWTSNNHKAVYQCAPNLVTVPHHFDLNLPLYTHFTSPLRRYIDLVVHRFVSAMIHQSPMPPYTRNQIESLCGYCSDADANDLMYTETMMQISESKMQPGRLIKYHGLVKEILEKSMSILLSSPSNQFLCGTSRDSVLFSALNLHSKPERLEDVPHILKLQWYIRVYDVKGFNPYYQNMLEMTSVPIEQWFQLLQHLKTNNIDNLKTEVKQLPSSHIELQPVNVELGSDDEDSFQFRTDDESESESERDDDLTSSDDDGDSVSSNSRDAEIAEQGKEDIKTYLVLKHYRLIEHYIQRGTVLQAWVVWQTYQEPEIKVIHFEPQEKISVPDNHTRKQDSREVNLAECQTKLETNLEEEEYKAQSKNKHFNCPGIDICIEHNNHPILCFSDLSVCKASMERYRTEEIYRDCWMPVLSMESAVSAVDDGDRVILQNVTIRWGRHHHHNHHVVTVRFELDKIFCDKYCIHFTRGDYVCVRFRTNPKMFRFLPQKKECGLVTLWLTCPRLKRKSHKESM